MQYLQQFQQYQQKIKGKIDYYKIQTIANIKKYWFKSFLIGVFVWIFMAKDISIQLNLNAPNTITSAATVVNQPVHTTKSTPKNTSLIEKKERPALAKKVIKKKKKNWTSKQLKQLKYVDRYAKIAKTEMSKYGIPASITLAQGLLESNIGKSTLATQNKNHFGIKCFSRKCAKGHCSNFADDSHKDFFRIFANSWESYRAHSLLLKNNKRYSRLFKLRRTDYKGWAKGLKKAGYATDKTYANKLIKLIEDLGLAKYDK